MDTLDGILKWVVTIIYVIVIIVLNQLFRGIRYTIRYTKDT